VVPDVALAMPPMVTAGPFLNPAIVGVALAFAVVAVFATAEPVVEAVVDDEPLAATADVDVSSDRLVAVSTVDDVVVEPAVFFLEPPPHAAATIANVATRPQTPNRRCRVIPPAPLSLTTAKLRGEASLN
jgi:hypothetical protein